MDKGTKMRTFEEHIKPKNLEEICDMPLHEANMQLQNEELGKVAEFVVGQTVNLLVQLTKLSVELGAMAGKAMWPSVKSSGKKVINVSFDKAKKLAHSFTKLGKEQKKAAKELKKAKGVEALRKARIELLDAKTRIETEKMAFKQISKADKALDKRRYDRLNKQLNASDKLIDNLLLKYKVADKQES